MSLALPSSSAERPSKSRRLTSLPSVAPTMRPVEATASTTSGSGLFQHRFRMQPGGNAGAHRRERLRLGEDLGIRADADFEILAPRALRDQHLLELHRRGRAGAQPREIVADQARHLGADRGGGGRVAVRALLDHALDHRDGEGDAGRLDRLQVDRRQQPRAAAVAGLRRRVGEQVSERRREAGPPPRASVAAGSVASQRSLIVAQVSVMSNASPSRTAITDGPP